ncbi:hypothetical protein ACFYUH_34830 [Streptomyces fimicarius]|uniref:hypothetical protein n=1 Tax=Streptomyces griseus TaxID=1911 RepID=UPI0036B2DB3C
MLASVRSRWQRHPGQGPAKPGDVTRDGISVDELAPGAGLDEVRAVTGTELLHSS